MIKIRTGNLLESDCQTLVNTVNCVGVMGKGIALEFKGLYPTMFKDYVAKCNRGEVKPGEPYLYRDFFSPWVINFPTKDHWRGRTKMEWIINGLEQLVCNYRHWGIESLAVPALGCGNGGLSWAEVGPIMYEYLEKLTIPVVIYAPENTPERLLRREFLESQKLAS